MFKILSLSVLALTAIANPAGVAMGLDYSLIKNGEKVLIPWAIEEVNSMNLTKITFDGGYVSHLKVNLFHAGSKNIDLDFDGKDNALNFTANNVGGHISGKIHYDWLIFSVHTNFDVKINDAASILAVVKLMGVQDKGKLIPQVDIKKLRLDLDAKKTDVVLSGSFVGDVAEMIVWMFKNVIINSIVRSVNKNLDEGSTVYINDMLMENDAVFETGLYNTSIDFSFTAQPEITEDQMQLFLNASVFNPDHPYIGDMTLPELPIVKATNDTVQADVSQVFINRALQAFTASGNLGAVINQTDIPEDVNFFLNTTFMDKIFNGLISKFGSDKPIDVKATLMRASTDLQEGSLTAHIDAQVSFLIFGESAFELKFRDINTQIDISLAELKITLKLESLAVENCTVHNSIIGNIDGYAIAALINFAGDIIVPIANAMIPVIDIPKNILEIVEIEAATFFMHEDYMTVTLTPQLN